MSVGRRLEVTKDGSKEVMSSKKARGKVMEHLQRGDRDGSNNRMSAVGEGKRLHNLEVIMEGLVKRLEVK
jgi:hypothetical protein